MPGIRNQAAKNCCVAFLVYGLSCALGVLLTLRFVPFQTAQHLLVHPTLQHGPWFYISHNLEIELLFCVGALTLGVGTFLILLVNGLFLGIFTTALCMHYGLGLLWLGLLPHGIPESIAWILIGGCSFYLSSYCRSNFFPGRKNVQLDEEDGQRAAKMQWSDRRIWKSYGVLLAVATVLIIASGFLEALVSTRFIMGL